MIANAELLKMKPDCISVQKGMKMWYVAAKSGHCTFHHFHFFNSEEEASALCARVRRHLAQNGKLNMDHWTLITEA